MPNFIPASRTCWLFLFASLITPASLRLASAAEPAKRQITVQMWVVEVSTDKLRNLGFDWSQITARQEVTTHALESGAALADAAANIDSRDFLGFLMALEKNNLARVLAEPTIATLSGRQASLTIGEHLKLDVTPTTIGDKHLQIQYRIEVGGDPAVHSSPLVAGSTVQVEPGKLCLVSQTRSSWQTADGKRRQTETLLLVRADYLAAKP